MLRSVSFLARFWRETVGCTQVEEIRPCPGDSWFEGETELCPLGIHELGGLGDVT
jgi:hypothetical protein